VLGISPFWDQAIWGLLLIVAIALDKAISGRLTSALRLQRTRHE
jgi:ribose/xylose/arabinose/galactoside ABC-type transport system permease subunit